MGSLGLGAEDGRFSGLGVLFSVRNGEDGFGGTKSRGCR